RRAATSRQRGQPFCKRPVSCILQGREESRRGPGERPAPEAVRVAGDVLDSPSVFMLLARPPAISLGLTPRRWPGTSAAVMLNLMSDVTGILSAIEQGDASAAEQLLPLVYDELRKLAAAKLAQEKPGQTLQATALVHEA